MDQNKLTNMSREAITDAVARLATGADAATVLADLDAEVRELYGQ